MTRGSVDAVVLLAAAGVLAGVYLVWLRPYLKTLPTFADLYAREESAWRAFKAWLFGRRVILIGLWGELIGFAPDLVSIVAGIDLHRLFPSMPDNWTLWISGVAVPMLMMVFRTKTATSPPAAS